MAEEIKPELKPVEPTPPVDTVPKSKEEWANLAKTDPGKFAELTQSRMDTIFRQSKEAQEKLEQAELREKNLLAEINSLKTMAPPVIPSQPIVPDVPIVYGSGVYPQTEEEWNNLFIVRPAFANDLRNEYLYKQRTQQMEFENNRKSTIQVLQQEHSDMYVPELDETGKPKKDANGKIVLKIDPTVGEPYFNPDSEKGKLWVEIFNENPKAWGSLKNAPQLMMAEMERRLRVKGASMVKGQNNGVNTDQSGVAPEGVPPPRNVSLKFASEEEKAHAQGMVNRGVYRDLEEYVKLRDEENRGYAEPNRRPDFTKR